MFEVFKNALPETLHFFLLSAKIKFMSSSLRMESMILTSFTVLINRRLVLILKYPLMILDA